MTTVWGIHVPNSQYSVRRDHLIAMILSRNLTSQGTREIAFFPLPAEHPWLVLSSLLPVASRAYLVQSPSAVSQKSNGVAIFHIHCHSCQTGLCFLQERGCFQGYPAGHRAGSVVRATGVCIQGVLFWGVERTGKSVRKRWIQGTLAPLTLPTIPFLKQVPQQWIQLWTPLSFFTESKKPAFNN